MFCLPFSLSLSPGHHHRHIITHTPSVRGRLHSTTMSSFLPIHPSSCYFFTRLPVSALLAPCHEAHVSPVYLSNSFELHDRIACALALLFFLLVPFLHFQTPSRCVCFLLSCVCFLSVWGRTGSGSVWPLLLCLLLRMLFLSRFFAGAFALTGFYAGFWLK